ncbi:hypothetical protein V5799_020330 [Amblyomma americanum]|uniref:Uncharacterized protein n=1 Tax=Amblyomma americanum TaxID=6943 RepID=A0AAQ4EUD8_AMBAM
MLIQRNLLIFSGSIGCLDAATILEPPAVDLLLLNYGSLRAPVASNGRIMRLPAVSLILTVISAWTTVTTWVWSALASSLGDRAAGSMGALNVVIRRSGGGSNGSAMRKRR